MKIDSKFKLRSIAGEHIIVNQGTVGADMTKIISLNSSACYLYEQLAGKDFTVADAARLLLDAYQIEEAVAERDAATWVDSLKKCHVIID